MPCWGSILPQTAGSRPSRIAGVAVGHYAVGCPVMHQCRRSASQERNMPLRW